MNTTPIKLAGEERTSVVNALTVAARQYEIVLHRGAGMVRMCNRSSLCVQISL
jgi:hypothetical protein